MLKRLWLAFSFVCVGASALLGQGAHKVFRLRVGEEVSLHVGGPREGVTGIEGLPPGLTYDPKLGVIRGVVRHEGSHTPQLRRNKGGSTPISMLFCVDCGGNQEPSNAAIVSPSGPITVMTGQSISFEATADGGSSPRWIFGDSTIATGYTATKAFSTVGTYNVTFAVTTNTLFFGSSASVTVTVVPAGPPSITSFTASPSTITNGQSSTLSWSTTGATSLTLNGAPVSGTSLVVTPTVTAPYTLVATNANGSTPGSSLTVTVVPPPSITSFTAAANPALKGGSTTITPVFSNGTGGVDQGIGPVTSGVAYGTGVLTSAKTYTLTVTNAAGTSVTQALALAVNAPPVFSAPVPAQSLAIGKPFSLTLPTATDPEGDAITYGVTGLPAGLSFNASTLVISGTPTTSGFFTVIEIATDSKGFSATQPPATFSVAPNNPPTFSVTSVPTLNVAVGQAFIISLPSATDQDQEPLTYSFPNWFTYSSNLGGATLNAFTMTLMGTIPASAVAGTYAVNFQARDAKGAIAVIPFTIVVTSTNPVGFGGATMPVPTLKVGSPMTALVLPAATDSGGQAISYAVAGLPEGLSFNSATRTVTGTPMLAGTFTVSETANVLRGYQVGLTGTWTVSAATYAPPLFQSTIPVSYNLVAGSPMTAVVWPAATDPNSGNTALTYAWTASAGSQLPPGLTFNPGTRTVSGTPTTGGNYMVLYTVTDSFGQTSSQTSTFMVAQDRPIITAFQASPTSINAGQSSTLTWSVAGADTVTLSPNIENDPIAANGVLAVSPSSTTAYVLTASNGAGSTSYMLLINVNGTAPSGVSGTASNLPSPPLSAFTKAQFEEALNYEWSDGTATGASTGTRSFTGLITSVDVTRALYNSLAGLTTASPKDQALRSHYDYGYDNLGQLLRANGSFYNDLNTPTAAWTDLTWYAYDAHGNRTQHKPREDGATAAPTRTYNYWSQASKGWDTNRLLSVTDSTGTPLNFDYDENGAVTLITRNGLNQTLAYGDPRHMRLPTHIERSTADGRTVVSDMVYDMSGTRTYKRDQINETSGTSPLVSDRATYYLANGTEVLMELESHGASTGAQAPDRFTAYIFGAGSRLARLSWDNDGRPATAGLFPQNVTNADFSNGTANWASSNATAAAYSDATLNLPALKVTRGATTALSYVEQTLGIYKAGDVLDLSALVKSDSSNGAMIGLYQAGAGDTPHTGVGAARIGRDLGTNCSLSRKISVQMLPGETWGGSVWFKAPTGTEGQLYLGFTNSLAYKLKKVTGNGAWQQIVLDPLVNSTGAAQNVWVYIYGDKSPSVDPRVLYDDLIITNTTTSATLLSEGFESGLRVTNSSNDIEGWYPSGQYNEWVATDGATQLVPAPAASWSASSTPYALHHLLPPSPASSEIRIRLLASAAPSLVSNLTSYFDNVQVQYSSLKATVASGKANYWRDPGFEGVLVPNGFVTTVGTPTLTSTAPDAGSGNPAGLEREGRKVLKIPAGSTVSYMPTGLTNGKTYLFSVWKKVGDAGAWQRETRTQLKTTAGTWITIQGTSVGQVSAPGIVLPLPDSTDGTQTVYYDQAELIEWNPATDTLPEAWIPENRLGRVDWFVTDHLGSTKLLVSQDGTMRYSGDDDPFGMNLRSMGDKDTHRYTGQILDEEQGVYYYGARYYLPEIGRFIAGDPDKEFLSVYVYVGNDPIRWVDPTGRTGEKPEVQATAEQLKTYQAVVVHETGGGRMSEASARSQNIPVHFVILQNGTVVQLASLDNHRSGTKTDSTAPSYRKYIPKAGQAPARYFIHIELDYNTDKNISLKDAQVKALADLIVNLASIKGSTLAVVPHREVDRGLGWPGHTGHNDPNNFPLNMFWDNLKKAMDEAKLPAGRLNIASPVVWETSNGWSQQHLFPPRLDGPIKTDPAALPPGQRKPVN